MCARKYERGSCDGNRTHWTWRLSKTFNVSFKPEEVKRKKAFYNFVVQDPGISEREGVSVFFKDPKGKLFRTYSTYARGIDAFSVDYQYLDIVPKGRDERGRGPYWVRRHDEYGK